MWRLQADGQGGGVDYEGRKQRENPEITQKECRGQAMERNIQDNRKVIWGMERIICHQQLQGTQEEM